jgi:hypothetical protein
MALVPGSAMGSEHYHANRSGGSSAAHRAAAQPSRKPATQACVIIFHTPRNLPHHAIHRSKPMFKIILLARKRPDISREQFMDYYSNHHVHFVSKLLKTGAAIHRRNFVVPSAVKVDLGANMDASADNDVDVITEVFYEDKAAADRAMRAFAEPEVQRLIDEDENNFLLRGSIKKYVVEVQETVFRPIPGHSI